MARATRRCAVTTSVPAVTAATGGTPLVEVVVADDFDARAVPRLRGLLDDALSLQPHELIIDLTDCPVVDAAAIGLLLDVHRRAYRAGLRLTVRCPSARLKRIFELARVDHVLHITAARPTRGIPRTAEAPNRVPTNRRPQERI